MSSTYTFDDGSTITTLPNGQVVATDATDPWVAVNRSSASWDPAAINPQAGSWDDVLKFGLSRLIDAKTRAVRPENTLPYYQTTPTIRGPFNSESSWIVIAVLAAVGIYVAVKSS